MWSVAWAIVASVVTSISDWHAAQVSANSEDDEPLWIFGAIVVVFGVAQRWYWNSLFDGNLFSSTMTNEERLSAPLEGNGFAFWDFSEFDFDFGQSKNISWCTHWSDELVDKSLCRVGWCNSGTWNETGFTTIHSDLYFTYLRPTSKWMTFVLQQFELSTLNGSWSRGGRKKSQGSGCRSERIGLEFWLQQQKW